jgi:hypothetical protein
MKSQQLNCIVNFLRDDADGLVCVTRARGNCWDVILPMTILRWPEAPLESTMQDQPLRTCEATVTDIVSNATITKGLLAEIIRENRK